MIIHMPDNIFSKFDMFRNYFIKKIGACFLAFFFTLSVTYIAPKPKTSEAFFGSIALAVKEYGLDGVAKYIAKRMLQMITRDTVNWINSGFNGSPGFITNPDRFALQVGDAAFNEFLSDETLNFLCSPFRANITAALRISYIGDVQYRCTLEDAGRNLQNFYDDFSQGGWDTWFTVTQNTANMPFGAYWEAQNTLYARIGSSQQTWQQKQDWGNGILSWDECTDPNGIIEFDTEFETQQTEFGPLTTPTGQANSRVRKKTPQECPAEYLESRTPGSLIENQLSNVFGSGILELGVGDEINEIIGALLDQFTIKLFNSSKGLFGLNNKIGDNPGRVISQVNYDNILEPDDPDVAEYCGSQREGFYPTATLKVGGDATFTTNRRDVTVQPGDVVTYSWCGANANQYASSYTVRQDLSSGCTSTGGNIPWIAQNAYGEQSATVGAEQSGCVYEITYAARNTAMFDELTGNTTTETVESKIIVRVGNTNPPAVAGQCTISEVTSTNLFAAANQISQEITGSVSVIGQLITIESSNGSVELMPVNPSGVSESIRSQVANQIGCDSTSNLTFVVFQVSNPNALPPEMLIQLGSQRPNQILVVIDSVGGTSN